MSSPLPPPPPSPGVAGRRKGPKSLPRLPMSAFSPPNTGTSDIFPLPPTPSVVFPDSIIDANVAATANIASYKEQTAKLRGSNVKGVVLNLQGIDASEYPKLFSQSGSGTGLPVFHCLVPFSLEDASQEHLQSYLQSSSKPTTSLSTVFIQNVPQAVGNLTWALKNSSSVDIDVQTDITDSDPHWEIFEELLLNAAKNLPEDKKGTPIIISNILPPPLNLDLPIVKLMNHPTYRMYQTHTATLSLVSNLYVKFLPPHWESPTPPTPHVSLDSENQDSKEKKEWKRRIKMYIGPVLEAFGYERIIFGSSPSSSSKSASSAADWYELARESFAELGVEQEAIDSIFSLNAKKVYGSP